jgi:DNA modification methylase
MANYTLYKGDCLEIMPTLEAGSIDLTVTSPPYDNLRTYGKDFDPDAFNWRGIIEELYRITAMGGVVVWVVADATINGSETGTSFRQALWAMECGFNLHDTMIYKVPGTGAKGSKDAYWQSFEYMFVWSKGDIKTVNRIKDKINKRAGVKCGVSENGRGRAKTRQGKWTVRPVGYRENVWVIPAGNGHDGNYGHEAKFPDRLAHDHVISWSNPGDTVFDPMMGSGTTGHMAMKLKRNFIGIELDAEYYRIAETRIKNAAGDYTVTDKERQAGRVPLFDW